MGCRKQSENIVRYLIYSFKSTKPINFFGVKLTKVHYNKEMEIKYRNDEDKYLIYKIFKEIKMEDICI